MGIWQLPVLPARILYVILPDVAAPDRQAAILLEGEIHGEAVVARGLNQGLGQGQELEPVLVREQVWAVAIRITRNQDLHPADRQEELCRPA